MRGAMLCPMLSPCDHASVYGLLGRYRHHGTTHGQAMAHPKYCPSQTNVLPKHCPSIASATNVKPMLCQGLAKVSQVFNFEVAGGGISAIALRRISPRINAPLPQGTTQGTADGTWAQRLAVTWRASAPQASPPSPPLGHPDHHHVLPSVSAVRLECLRVLTTPLYLATFWTAISCHVLPPQLYAGCS